ncbi:Alpha/Beta hydrolase fold [Naviculisporaceae sp. PSN 640]
MTLTEKALALGSEQDMAPPPVLKIRLPFPHRLNCFIRLWLLKLLVRIAYNLDRLIYPPPLSIGPTAIRYYPCNPKGVKLQARIFFPRNYSSAYKALLPTYFSIHGGGFAVGDPQQDDEWCTMWAKRTSHLVISLDYRKAPLHTFPSAVHDIAGLAGAILSDSSLPIDKSRVSIGGFSAGANLALCASQLPPLKNLVKAAIAYYPPVNWDHYPHDKLARRPYDAQRGDVPNDNLANSGYWFDWAYVSPGTDRRHPLLSPYFAKKEDLPPWIYMIAAEYDMLRLEAQIMIHELAETSLHLKGAEHPEDFEVGRYKWTLAKGCSHGFTHHFGLSEGEKRKREEKCEVVYEQAERWLAKAVGTAD